MIFKACSVRNSNRRGPSLWIAIVLLILRQGIEEQSLRQSFPIVGFDSLSDGGELSVMHEGAALVVEAPQLAGDEFAIALKELRRSGGLVLIKRLAFRLGCRRGIPPVRPRLPRP